MTIESVASFQNIQINITIPIMMLKSSEEDKDVIEYQTINKATAFWMQDKKELSQSDYDEFYKSLTY